MFIECSVDKVFTGLIKYGHCGQYNLLLAWDQIYREYAEKSGGTTYRLLNNLNNDIEHLEKKRFNIAVILKILVHRPVPSLIKILHDYGYPYKFDISNPEQYAKDIQTVATRTGALTLSITQKTAERSKNMKNLEGKEITRDHFQQILTALSEFMHYPIKPKETTVLEFIEIRKSYEATIERMKSQTEKKGVKHG